MKPGALRFLLHLALIMCACLSISPAHAERRVALIIGNSTYTESPLKNAVNDAQDMRERLMSLGFAKADIVYRENLKTSQIGALLNEWQGRLNAGGDTVALLFYAGHGLQIGGENYFPTIDARIDSEFDVPRHAVKLAELLGVMEKSRTRLNLVFLDACRNNPFERRWRSARDLSRGLAREILPSGTLIAYATRPGSVANDGGSGRNGVFTGELLQHLSQRGLTVDQIIRRVVRGVRASTANKQDPWTEGSIDEDFYFVAAAPEPAPRPIPQPAPQPLPVARTDNRPRPGQTIKDCDICPELVTLPRGSFMMGSPDKEPERNKTEGPVHRVSIDYDLAVGKYEITQGQWKAVMGSNPSYFKDCGDNCPVEQVSWNDAQEYLKQLNARSGQRYRLLSEAEWEYAARAGTTTPFHTGQTITTQQANFNGDYTYNGSAKGVYREKTVAVGSFASNAFGLHDMHGNVWEWVQDVYHDNYTGAPENGSAWESGGDAEPRVLRGGSWDNFPRVLRSAFRVRFTPDVRNLYVGFRFARTY